MGSLEGAVLAQLWRAPNGATPAEVLDALDNDLAYTTVMTILSRLAEKGLATRTRRGKAFAYVAAVTEAELVAQRMQSTLATSRNRKAALVQFVATLPARDARALRALFAGEPKRQ